MENQSVYLKPITLKNIMKFALPTIAMSLFMSFYTMVDGLFVSNLIGTNALSAVNLSAPIIALVTAISTMLATGGSAVIMKKIGEKRTRESNEDFTFLIIVNIIVGVIMCLVGYVCMNFIFSQMNVSAEVLHYSQDYLGHYLLFTIPILLMNNFSLYLIASGKSAVSFICSVAGGIVNIILDYLLIKVVNIGISGAAIATGLGYSVTAIVGFIIFCNKKNLLHFTKPSFCFRVLKKAVSNGCSEMATALVTGITTLIFNWTMLKYVGENGVAAITIIMYVLMFVSSLFSGYSYGVAPMISYYYGEQNHVKLKKLIRISLKIIAVISVISLIMSLLITKPLVGIFARPDNPVFELAVMGNRICSIALLFIGFNIFSSGMFTALNNGIISAILAFSRSFVFMIICLLVLPLLFGVTGIWLATPLAELLAISLAFSMFMKYKNKYKF
ncbi:MAG: MATE family efflux transporter [[Clostridium] spiroforme]|uniref:Multidrug export protein MepA n=1 Tax=Thomasclavelia spiroformis TaxID=29348 RepID=A0A943I6F6_9FIRM|nr:MATE family efflux transporter [Thomasclavelia spiroformis]MBS5588475.1 MATE family efflux transporter [Thomasclavelia spiroformis]